MVEFHSFVREMRYRDPRKGFAEVRVPVEWRVDPLTAETSRVCVQPSNVLRERVDWSPVVKTSQELGCPFCPEHVRERTPAFPEDLVPGGRVCRGSAVLFPNMFPYDAVSALVALTEPHYVPMAGFTADVLVDGFLAAREYLAHVVRRDPSVRYASVNWNYMPWGGGSIIHPHFQIFGADVPSNYHRRALAGSRRYFHREGRSLFLDLVATERERGDRYIARTGKIEWMTSFAPRSLALDVLAVWGDAAPLPEVAEDVVRDFANGLLRIIAYIDSMNFPALNMAVFFPTGLAEDEGARTHARIIPRFLFQPLGTADQMTIHTLHDEPVIVKSPEAAAEEIRRLWTASDA